MKIAFITPSLRIGGYEGVVVEYANELVKRGNEVYILCGFLDGELIKKVNSKVNLINFNSRLRNYIFPLINFLKEKKDLDILYSGFRGYNFISVIAKKIAKNGVVIYATQHGFEKNNIILEKLMGKVINKADIKIGVSKMVLKNEEIKLGLKGNCKVLYNPVINHYNEPGVVKHKWFLNSKPIIINCGRLSKDKNQALSLKIFSEVVKEIECYMILLGTGPELDNLKLLAKDLNIENKVDFIGYVKYPIEYMKHCNLLLHTSDLEGFGNVIVEALYSNLPVVMTDCGGGNEIICDGKYGIIIGKKSDCEIIKKGKEAICAILNNDIKFSNSKQRAVEFNVEKATDCFLNIYHE